MNLFRALPPVRSKPGEVSYLERDGKMNSEVELFVDAIDGYKKACEDRDNDPDGFIGDDSPTWVTLNTARITLRHRFKRAVLSVLGN